MNRFRVGLGGVLRTYWGRLWRFFGALGVVFGLLGRFGSFEWSGTHNAGMRVEPLPSFGIHEFEGMRAAPLLESAA